MILMSAFKNVTFNSVTGPIASIFVNRFGCRPVTIVGSVISAICIFISQYARNVNTLIVTLGFGTGECDFLQNYLLI
jgi:nitrate/nitrite transporter NarK